MNQNRDRIEPSGSPLRQQQVDSPASSLVTIMLNQESPIEPTSEQHQLESTGTTSVAFVDLAQVTSSEMVDHLASTQTPTTSDSSMAIGSSFEFNRYRDVDVHSLASSKRTDDSDASTARSHRIPPAGRYNRNLRRGNDSDDEDNDNAVRASTNVRDKHCVLDAAQTNGNALRAIDENNNNQANDNEIANITDIWIQEENQAEAVDASPAYSNDDSLSNQPDDTELQQSISSPNDESFAENSNHSPNSQQGRSSTSPESIQSTPQTLPQSTLTPMPLVTGSAASVNPIPSLQPSLETPTSTTTSSHANDNTARTSSTLISQSQSNANEPGASNSISHYSIFTRIRSQLSASQSNVSQPAQQPPSQPSPTQPTSSSVTKPARRMSVPSTFKFEPKSHLFNNLVEEYYKEFADETDPMMRSSTLNDVNLPAFSFINENFDAFCKLSKLFLSHENYYCTMFLPMKRVYGFSQKQELSPDYSEAPTTHESSHKHSKKPSHKLMNQPEADKNTDHPASALNNDEFEAMIAAVTGINKWRPSENSNSVCETSPSQSHRRDSSAIIQPLLADQDQGDRKSGRSGHMLQKSSEFFTCSLCSHYLHEPITLVCGCSYCRNCLIEYNKTLERKKLRETMLEMKLRKKNRSRENEEGRSTEEMEAQEEAFAVLSSDTSDEEEEHLMKILNDKNLFRNYSYRQNKVVLHQCYNCGKTHEHNTVDHLKVNVFVSKLVDKLWARSVDVRQLRNDIRHFICYEMEIYDKFNLHKYEYLLKQAYKMDQTNHLVLADLFMINYFSGCMQNCLKYANMLVQLRPNWTFSYFMRAIYYHKMNDLYRLKSNLILCLHLDPNIEQIRIQLFQILMKTNHNLLVDSPVAMCPYASKKLKMNNNIAIKTTNEELSDMSDSSMSKSSNAPYKRARSSNFDGSQCDSISLKKHQKFSTSPCKDASLDSSPDSMNSFEDDKTSSQFENAENSRSKNSSSESPQDQRPQRSTLNSVWHESPSDLSSQKQDDNSKYLSLDSNLVKVADLECSLCYRLILNPVTTPCGHSFCCSCLDRSLDHQDKCPLCKHSLAEYLAERRSCTTSFIEKLVRIYFSNEYDERKKQYEEELKDLASDDEIPVFVCTLALPNAPCPLHIYEPRYRLMLRRAIETGSRQFGMCMYSERTQHRYTEYGCMLEIQNYQFSRDGRAIVHSVGGRRFKVVKSSTKDGYNVAKVEWVKDERATDPQEVAELQYLHDEVYQLALTWFSYIPNVQKNKILEIYGMGEIPAPEEDIQTSDNGPAWHWFVLSILPLENDFQYKFLTKTSLKERLRQMKRIILILLKPFDRSSSSLPNSLASSTTNLAHGGDEVQATSNSAGTSPNQRS